MDRTYDDRTARPAMGRRGAAHAAVAVAALLGGAALYLLVPEFGMWVRQAGNLLRSAEVQGLRMLLHRSGPLEPFVAMALAAYVAVVPGLPFAPLAHAVIGRLGAPAGLLALVAGATAGATVAFSLSAALTRPFVRRLPGMPAPGSIRALPWLALLIRLLPWFGQAWVSYLTGALPLRFRDHLWTATVGATGAVVLALLR